MRLCACLSLVLISPSLGEVFPFDWTLTKSNVDVMFTIRIYEGYPPAPNTPPLLELEQALQGTGRLAGYANVDGGYATSVRIQSFSLQVEDPFYVDGYVQGVHLELWVDRIGLIGYSGSDIPTSQTGHFGTSAFNAGFDPNSICRGRIGDLAVLPFDPQPQFPHTHLYPISGDLTIANGVSSMDFFSDSTTRMCWDLGGLYYTFDFGVVLDCSVPEPTSVLVIALGLPALLRRRGFQR
jgi:hypothetical protein